jgi:WD40 repeat protein
VWDTSSWKEILSAKADKEIESVAWSPNGDSIAIGNLGGGVDVLRSASLQSTFSIKANGGVHSLAYSPDACFIIFSGSYVSAQIWDSNTGNQVADLGYGYGMGLALTLSPKGDLALISDNNYRPSESTSMVMDISDYLRCNISRGHK